MINRIKTNHIKTIALVAILVAAVAFGGPTNRISRAQDAMIVCDSDLILNLFIAEYYFGYGAMTMEMMEGDDMMEMVDVSLLDKGQFAPAFDMMMGMMDENMMMENMMMDEATMESVMSMMAMSDEELMAAMGEMGEMTMLAPVVVDGEPEACTALRAQLNRFFTILVYNNMMMMGDQ